MALQCGCWESFGFRFLWKAPPADGRGHLDVSNITLTIFIPSWKPHPQMPTPPHLYFLICPSKAGNKGTTMGTRNRGSKTWCSPTHTHTHTHTRTHWHPPNRKSFSPSYHPRRDNSAQNTHTQDFLRHATSTWVKESFISVWLPPGRLAYPRTQTHIHEHTLSLPPPATSSHYVDTWTSPTSAQSHTLTHTNTSSDIALQDYMCSVDYIRTTSNSAMNASI